MYFADDITPLTLAITPFSPLLMPHRPLAGRFDERYCRHWPLLTPADITPADAIDYLLLLIRFRHYCFRHYYSHYAASHHADIARLITLYWAPIQRHTPGWLLAAATLAPGHCRLYALRHFHAIFALRQPHCHWLIILLPFDYIASIADIDAITITLTLLLFSPHCHSH